MAGLSLETGYACLSLKAWSKEVKSASGKTYTVSFEKADDPWARGREYDWSCTCPDFKARKSKKQGEYCKHIHTVIDDGDPRCCWYELFNPEVQAIQSPRYTCPNCGSKVFELEVLHVRPTSLSDEPPEPEVRSGHEDVET